MRGEGLILVEACRYRVQFFGRRVYIDFGAGSSRRLAELLLKSM